MKRATSPRIPVLLLVACAVVNAAQPGWSSAGVEVLPVGRGSIVSDAVAMQQSKTTVQLTELTAIVARGRELFQARRYEDSRRHFERELQRAVVMGPASESIVLAWLGFSYLESGRLQDAQRTLARCVALREQLWSSENLRDRSHAQILTALGGARLDLGEYEDAERTLHEAGLIWGRLPGIDKKPEYASYLNSLGMMRYRQERYSDAARLLREALMLLRSSISGEDPRIAQVMVHLAAALSRSDGHAEADAVSAQALDCFLVRLEKEPVVQAELLLYRAIILREAKRDREAKGMEQRAETLRRKAGLHHVIDMGQLGVRSRRLRYRENRAPQE